MHFAYAIFRLESFDFLRIFASLSRYPLSVLLFLQPKSLGLFIPSQPTLDLSQSRESLHRLHIPSDILTLRSSHLHLNTQPSRYQITYLTPSFQSKYNLPGKSHLNYGLIWPGAPLFSFFLWQWGILNWVLYGIQTASLNDKGNNTLLSVHVFWSCVWNRAR